MNKLGSKELSRMLKEAEGDETDDGLTDYDEYVAFAVDMLLCMRARDQGKALTTRSDAATDATVRSIMNKQDLGKIVGACLKQCGNVDHLKSG